MRRLRIITLICFVLAALLLAASTMYRNIKQDDTIPVIECPEEPLVLSVAAGEEALLADVTAYDEKDGDLTGQVLLQGISKNGDTATVTYAVVDSDNHVSAKSRTLQYTDYVAPRFALNKELRYSVGSQIRIKDRMTAEDLVDGDLSDRIRVTASSLTAYNPGIYPATFEVTNSMGDSASLTLDIVVRNYESGEPQIRLTEYLVYRAAGDDFDPMDYLDSVSGGDESAVTAELPADGLRQGLCQVTYTCEGWSGIAGSTTLYVVTE